MLDKAIKVLKKLEENGYESYIVGGFVRDYLLGRESNDIDICTSATPKQIKEVFIDACLPSENYGSVILQDIDNHHFEITTFRKELEYSNDRKPIQIEYIDDLKLDLLRRDFTINTICMNSNREIIDLLNGQNDLNNRTISSVGDSYFKFSQDPLRILRAVRFATILDFELSNDIKFAIKRSKKLLDNLSLNKKKEELDKIFSSINIKKGIELLIELELDTELKLKNLDKLLTIDMNDLIGVWSIIDVLEIYPFSNNEKDLINKIKELYSIGDINKKTLYKYDLYVNSIVGNMLSYDKKKVIKMYQELPIKSRKDLCVNGDDIITMLKIEPSKDIKTILSDIEDKIVDGKLENERKAICKYVVKNYL